MINPKASGSGDRSKSNFPSKDYSLPGDRYNPNLNDTCFRCWEKHLKSETCKAEVPLPRPTSIPITEVRSKKRNETNAKDKRGIIDEMYLFIMSDNNNYTI